MNTGYGKDTRSNIMAMLKRDRYFWTAVIFLIIAMLVTYLGEEELDQEWHMLLTLLRGISLLIVVVIAGWKYSFRTGLGVWFLIGIILTPHVIIDIHRGKGPEVLYYALLGILGFTVIWLTNYIHSVTKALQANRKELDSVLNNAPLIAMIVDRELEVCQINQAGAKFIDHGEEGVLGLCVGRILGCVQHVDNQVSHLDPPCDVCPIRTTMLDSLTTGKSHHKVEISLKVSSRKGLVTFLLTTVPFILKEGLRILVYIEDITERKQAEESLKESEGKYRFLFEGMLEGYIYGMVTMDEEGNPADLLCLEVNDAFEKLTGLKKEDVVGKKAFKEISVLGSINQQSSQIYSKVALTGEKARFDLYFETLGKWLTVSVYSPKKDYFAIVFDDITERKQAEDALRESETSLREAQRIAHLGNWSWDIINNQVKWSEELFRILGLHPQEAVPAYKVFHGHIHPEDRGFVRKTFADALQKTKSYSIEYRILRSDGSEGIVHDVSEVVDDETGRPIRISGTIYDITEHKKMEEKIAHTDRLASIGEMVSGVTHELNNPLTSIIGFSEILIKHDATDAIKEDLILINKEAQRASLIIKNLLRFARKYTPRKEMVNIISLIEAVLELRAHEQKSNNIEIVRRFSPDLPEFMADGFQLQQVFLNIIINAEYFMIEAHKRGTLIITTERAGSIARISFADDGPGIAPQNLAHLFDPFFSTKSAGKGTGLGLSICYGTITGHGGQIYAESEAGKGATFIIELPVNDIDQERKKT